LEGVNAIVVPSSNQSLQLTEISSTVFTPPAETGPGWSGEGLDRHPLGETDWRNWLRTDSLWAQQKQAERGQTLSASLWVRRQPIDQPIWDRHFPRLIGERRPNGWSCPGGRTGEVEQGQTLSAPLCARWQPIDQPIRHRHFPRRPIRGRAERGQTLSAPLCARRQPIDQPIRHRHSLLCSTLRSRQPIRDRHFPTLCSLGSWSESKLNRGRHSQLNRGRQSQNWFYCGNRGHIIDPQHRMDLDREKHPSA